MGGVRGPRHHRLQELKGGKPQQPRDRAANIGRGFRARPPYREHPGMRHKGGRILTALTLAVAGAGLTYASVFLKEDIASLKKTSDAVVRARVTDSRSYWNDDRSMIFTDVTLQVKGLLHGASGNTIVVRVPGGTVGDFTAEME